MDDVLERVLETKHGVPLPADIIKTTGNKNIEVLTYMPAWRKIKEGGYGDIDGGVKNFQLILPYLED